MHAAHAHPSHRHRKQRLRAVGFAALAAALTATVPASPSGAASEIIDRATIDSAAEPVGEAVFVDRIGPVSIEPGLALPPGHPDAPLRVVSVVDRSGRPVIEVTAAYDVAGLIAAVADALATPRLVSVELDGVVHASSVPPTNDPGRDEQWGLDEAAFEQVWDWTGGEGVVVAVVDSGIDAGRVDLSGQMVGGWDAIWNQPGGTYADCPHGTHVAGIIAAAAHNLVGVTGAAPGARVLPVRALSGNGTGYVSDIAEGIIWAVDHGAGVVNLSLGGPQSGTLQAAVGYALSRDVVVVAAAGNDSTSAPSYPAAYPDVLAVGAVGRDLNGTLARAPWSNTGPHLDIVAPGVDILSLAVGSDTDGLWVDGTSQASPHVAALAALLRSAHPLASAAQVRAWITDSARDLGAPGHDEEYGNGFLDPPAALTLSGVGPAPAPPAPGGVTVEATLPRALVSWTTVAASDVDHYLVTRGDGTTFTAGRANSESADVASSAGATYRVQAIDWWGRASDPSPTVTVTAPPPVPPPPPPARAGVWVVGADGRVVALNGRHHGDLGGRALSAPIVAAAATRTGDGYWLVATNGAVYPFGDARSHGSMAGQNLSAPIVGMAATTNGHGYWLLGADGGIFSFGDAAFHGSTGAITLNEPVVDMAATATGHGYWLVATDGGVFSFGDAAFHGSTGAIQLNAPVRSITRSDETAGYWMVGRDGGIFAFEVPFHGSLPGLTVLPAGDGLRIRATNGGAGYYVLTTDGALYAFGSARTTGSATAGLAGVAAVDLIIAGS
jgi:subtilisin family serine protease